MTIFFIKLYIFYEGIFLEERLWSKMEKYRMIRTDFGRIRLFLKSLPQRTNSSVFIFLRIHKRLKLESIKLRKNKWLLIWAIR